MCIFKEIARMDNAVKQLSYKLNLRIKRIEANHATYSFEMQLK